MRQLTPLVAGCVLLAASVALAQDRDHATASRAQHHVHGAPSGAMPHAHGPIALPDEAPTPALSLRLSADAVSGFNLELVLERFSLQPPPAKGRAAAPATASAVDPESGFAEGHAHLYVNGEKIQRLYGRNVHLPGALFRPGINQITVGLNDHAHRYWTRGERAVLATLFVDPSRDAVEVHRFESFPVAAARVARR